MATAAPAGPPPVAVRARPAALLVLTLFAVSVLLLVLLTVEIALRVGAFATSAAADPRCAGADTAQSSQKGLYVPDVEAGYVMRPNACIRLRTSEYDEVLRTNPRGMVGPDVSATKPPGEFRIVVLGDSYVVGGQVPYERTFPAVLERDLRQEQRLGNVRVINAGVGGYSTMNEAGLLRENLAWLQPDLVVVAAFVGNDVAENVLATRAGYVVDADHPKGLTFGADAAALVRESMSWFPRNPPSSSAAAVASPDPPLTRLKTGVRRAWDAARGYSLALGALFGAPPDLSVSTAPGARPPAREQRVLNITSFEWTILRDIPRVSALDEAWPLFGRYLADIRATADSVGAPVLVVVVPHIGQVVPDERARIMAEFRFREDEVDWLRPQRELAQQAEQVGLPLLDLLPRFAASGERDRLYLPIDQHFSAAGHRLTAALLTTELLQRHWLPRETRG